MKKSDLVDVIAQRAKLNHRQADEALTAMLDAIAYSLSLEQAVVIVGFGRFYANKVAERTGRHPQTGKSILLKAHLQPQFRPSSEFKKALNSINLKCGPAEK